MKHDLSHSSPEVIEQTLWEYIDGSIAADEQTLIEKLIAENAAWRSKYNELLEVNQLLLSTELDEPSMRFTRNVMEEIAKYHIAPATKQYINNKIIFGIAAFFITVILSFVIYGFSQINWTAASDSSSPIGIDLRNVDYGRMFNNNFVNVFMMLNVVLGLMLFDRYLNSKRKKWAPGN
jgi:hypothetical protein